MSLYTLLGLTLLCGLIVIIGMPGSFTPHSHGTNTQTSLPIGAELKHGFKLRGWITVLVILLLVALIIETNGHTSRYSLSSSFWTPLSCERRSYRSEYAPSLMNCPGPNGRPNPSPN